MKRSISAQFTARARVAGLLMVPVLAMAAAACGSSSHPRVTSQGDTGSGPGALAGGAQTSPAASPSGAIATGTASRKSVALTTPAGYQYQISLASSGIVAMNSFTTDDGTGEGGTPVDAPPGSKILVAQIVFNNKSGRSEPLADAPIGPMPADADGSGFILGVPVSDASAFGIDSSMVQVVCSTSNPPAGTPETVPTGYCSLSTQIGAYSPAQTDITQPPQLASGASGTVTFITDQTTAGTWVPQGAPVSDVKVFYAPNATCYCWAALSR